MPDTGAIKFANRRLLATTRVQELVCADQVPGRAPVLHVNGAEFAVALTCPLAPFDNIASRDVDQATVWD